MGRRRRLRVSRRAGRDRRHPRQRRHSHHGGGIPGVDPRSVAASPPGRHHPAGAARDRAVATIPRGIRTSSRSRAGEAATLRRGRHLRRHGVHVPAGQSGNRVRLRRGTLGLSIPPERDRLGGCARRGVGDSHPGGLRVDRALGGPAGRAHRRGVDGDRVRLSGGGSRSLPDPDRPDPGKQRVHVVLHRHHALPATRSDPAVRLAGTVLTPARELQHAGQDLPLLLPGVVLRQAADARPRHARARGARQRTGVCRRAPAVPERSGRDAGHGALAGVPRESRFSTAAEHGRADLGTGFVLAVAGLSR